MLTENALKVAQDRYFMDGENWNACVQRVSRTVASQEEHRRDYWTAEFADAIANMYFLPAGRILRNAGRTRGSMFNCYVLPIGDSREEIGDYFRESLILWGEGGGVGVNISPLRPRGAKIHGVGGNSSGPVSFLVASDAIAATVESGGSRRAAALACMHVEHPDIDDFITAKVVDGRLPHYNISVAVTNEFLDCVEDDGMWQLRFKEQSFGQVPARGIWEAIVSNMVAHAEPGLLNWDRLRENNSYYFDPVTSTNPCGEAVLPPYGVCDLGSIALPRFVTPKGQVRWKKLDQVIRVAVRFLDNVIDVNKYVLPQIDVNAHTSRRIGLGVMGLAEYLFAKQLRYGSPEAIADVESLMKFIRDVVYDSLVELAVEKGAFPKFDRHAYSKATFVGTLPAELRRKIKQHGVRCVTSMAIAPTGTISLLADMTSGIEPLFSKAYLRRDRVGERVYIHPLFRRLVRETEGFPDWYVDSGDLSPKDHLETQVAVQKYVDGAVSKTINLPAGATPEELSDLLIEYVRDLKGVTVYVDGSREGQILQHIPNAEIFKYLDAPPADRQIDACGPGICEV